MRVKKINCILRNAKIGVLSAVLEAASPGSLNSNLSLDLDLKQICCAGVDAAEFPGVGLPRDAAVAHRHGRALWLTTAEIPGVSSLQFLESLLFPSSYMALKWLQGKPKSVAELVISPYYFPLETHNVFAVIILQRLVGIFYAKAPVQHPSNHAD